MSSKWRELTFGDFVAIQRGHDLPDQYRRAGTVPILGSFGITGFHDTAKAKGPGVTIGRSGASFGIAAYTDEDYWPLNTALYVTDFKSNDPKFVFYFMKAFDFSGFNSGSAQPSLNRNNLYPVAIRVPDPSEQKAIAELLGALDDRIALLRETNATLEAIAQTLFKSWFVDFDPVHANAGTQAPTLPPETQALFPSTFTDTPQGLVPEGWRVGCLGEIVSLRNEKIKASSETEVLPYVPIESITAKSPFLEEHKPGSEANSSLTLFRNGDILFGAMRPYFHKVCLAPFDGVTRTTVFTLSPKNSASTAFGLFSAFQESTIEYATQHSEGSTIPYAKWKNSLELMPAIVAPLDVQQAFNDVVMPMIASANANIAKAQTLATLRDTLLPRLISGQLRLPDAAAEVQFAVEGTAK